MLEVTQHGSKADSGTNRLTHALSVETMCLEDYVDLCTPTDKLHSKSSSKFYNVSLDVTSLPFISLKVVTCT